MSTTTIPTLEQAANIIDQHSEGAALADVLMQLQSALGFIPPQAVPLIAEKTGAERPAIYKAIELSPSFTLTPPGKHLLYICSADNCCSKGGLVLADTARRVLNTEFYRCDASQTVRLEPFRCLGNCINGPNIALDGQVQGPTSPEQLETLLRGLLDPH